MAPSNVKTPEGSFMAVPLHLSISDLRLSVTAAVLAACVSGVSAAAGANNLGAGKVFPLDDSMSVVQIPTVTMSWDGEKLGRAGGNTARGVTRVLLVLNTTDYVGKRVRIHQTMAPSSVNYLVRWTGTGVIQSGETRPGQRVLVYEGLVKTRRLDDTLSVGFIADGTLIDPSQRLKFSFDIEILP